MDSPDVVHPVDAALNELLGQIADNTDDEQRKQEIYGVMLTAPPFVEWSQEFREQLHETVDHVLRVRRDPDDERAPCQD